MWYFLTESNTKKTAHVDKCVKNSHTTVEANRETNEEVQQGRKLSPSLILWQGREALGYSRGSSFSICICAVLSVWRSQSDSKHRKQQSADLILILPLKLPAHL